MSTTQNDLQLQIDELQNNLEIMKQLGTQTGFIQFYFTKLKEPQFKSNQDCFHYVNDLYHSLFDEYRYSDFNSFRQIIRRNFKK